MRGLIQRVTSAEVSIEGKVIGNCGYGMLVYQSICPTDTEDLVSKFVDKLLKIRIFPDENGKTNLNIHQIPQTEHPKILLISNYSLYADVSKSLRPSFMNVGEFSTAKKMYHQTIDFLKIKGMEVGTGEFGGDMVVRSHAEVFNLIIDIHS